MHLIEGRRGLLVPGLAPTRQTEEDRAALPPQPLLRNKIRSNGVQVRRELGGRLVTPSILHQRQKYLLRYFFGHGPVAEHPVREIEYASLVSPDKLFKRGLIPSGVIKHERFVRSLNNRQRTPVEYVQPVLNAGDGAGLSVNRHNELFPGHSKLYGY